MSDSESPLLPSILYAEGSEAVKREVEEDLQRPDPEPEEALAAIASALRED